MRRTIFLFWFIVALIFAAFVSCSDEPTNPPTTDAGTDALEPVFPIDAATCGNGNGGIGACVDPVKDCPPEDPCWYFVCAVGSTEFLVCKGVAKDAGP